MNTPAWRTIVVLGLMVLACLSGCDDAARQIREADEASNRALDAHDGAAAVKFLSKGSVDRLSDLITKARKAKKADVQKLPYADKFDVLVIRLLIEPSRLRKMNGREAYVEMVNRGWMNSTSGFERQNYKYSKDKTQATVTYIDRRSRTWFKSYWILEDGGWKEDHVADVVEIGRWAAENAKEAKITEEELLLEVLGDLIEDDVPEKVWTPTG
jgi:hypothetical protein